MSEQLRDRAFTIAEEILALRPSLAPALAVAIVRLVAKADFAPMSRAEWAAYAGADPGTLIWNAWTQYGEDMTVLLNPEGSDYGLVSVIGTIREQMYQVDLIRDGAGLRVERVI